MLRTGLASITSAPQLLPIRAQSPVLRTGFYTELTQAGISIYRRD